MSCVATYVSAAESKPNDSSISEEYMMPESASRSRPLVALNSTGSVTKENIAVAEKSSKPITAIF